MDSLVSVLVPVYNVKKYLSRCLDSVINQTYKNLEVILVDDGSTDGSGQICDLYSEKYSNFFVIHKENGGLSSARNIGIEKATGEYIYMIDSDDYLMPNTVEVLYKALNSTGCDIAMCGCYVNTVDKSAPNSSEPNIKKIWKKDEFLPAVLKDEITSHVWNKLFKKNVLNGVTFPLGMVAQDMGVMHEIFNNAESLVEINNKLYVYYFERPDNTSNITSKKLISYLHRAIHFENRYEFSKKYCPQTADYTLKLAVFFYTKSYKWLLQNKRLEDPNTEKILNFLITNKKNIFSNVLISRKEKIKVWLITHRYNGILKLLLSK